MSRYCEFCEHYKYSLICPEGIVFHFIWANRRSPPPFFKFSPAVRSLPACLPLPSEILTSSVPFPFSRIWYCSTFAPRIAPLVEALPQHHTSSPVPSASVQGGPLCHSLLLDSPDGLRFAKIMVLCRGQHPGSVTDLASILARPFVTRLCGVLSFFLFAIYFPVVT